MLFLGLFEKDVLSKSLAVLLQLYFLLNSLLILAGNINLAGLFIPQSYEFIL